MTRTFGNFQHKLFDRKYFEPLICPFCGGNNLHHLRVTSFDRKEDAPETTVTEVEGGKVAQVVAASDQTTNPSSRRDGLVIRFYCESCPATPEMTLEQHKGSTLVGWR